ncbi:MAG: response regulator [Deltaproteobacteria bacterium]|nr:response regulator [Deltaproteobacteria bacterium]
MADWQILVVDDEPDILAITTLALKTKRWRNRRFNLIGAASAEEAKQQLRQHGKKIQVAMVDVVMETDDAGLHLCQFIRENCPRSLRIVLRTGQPGVAPEEKVLNEYDIDYYLAKAEATPDRLYSIIRAALRASIDVETFLALKAQLTRLVDCFRNLTSPKQLAAEMRQTLSRLEEKYGAKLAFFANAHTDIEGSEIHRQAVLKAIGTGKWEQLVAGADVGLDDKHFAVPFKVEVAGTPEDPGRFKGLVKKLRGALDHKPVSAAMQTVEGGLVVSFETAMSALDRSDFLYEFTLALDQWKLAYSVLCIQEDVAFQRVLAERHRRERIEAVGA